MAYWISSKLKAAETLLQQIDQQAAESLRKNEKQTSDNQSVVETSVAPETRPLVKDQLKMKASENVVSQISIPSDRRDLNLISKSNNDVNRNDETGRSLNLNSKSNLSVGLTDSDWTELLSMPDKKLTSGGGVVTQSSNRVSVIRAPKKNGKKVGNSGQGLNLYAVDGRSEKVRNNGVLKNSRKSNVGLEISSSSVGSDEKASNGGDSTPRTSSVQSLSSGGESDQRDSTSTPVTDNRSTSFMGEIEGVNDVAGDKLHLLDKSGHSSQMMSTSLERETDKVGLNDGERLKMAISESNRSRISSRIPSAKKVSSLPSEEESNSETDTTSLSDSESEREKEERRKRRQQILAERAAAKAIEAIKERENIVAKLDGEKQSLEKILEERAKLQVQEASELQTTMMETMEAVELEKQKHNNTRMEVFARLAKVESANADLTRSLANAQKHLEVEADRLAELRQQIQKKEAAHEELRRKISSTHRNGDKLRAPKGVEFKLEMLETEYSFVADKVERMQEQSRILETSIETTRRELENPSQVEIELKRRLGQLTDHLIQKQAQVESLSSEKAMLLLRLEAVSRLLDEHGSTDFPSTSSRDDLEQGPLQLSHSNLKGRMQSGQKHLGSLVRQLDSIFCTGAMFLRRNSTARIWSLVYLACLHLWVIYILATHSPVSDEDRSGAVVSLENINNTGGV